MSEDQQPREAHGAERPTDDDQTPRPKDAEKAAEDEAVRENASTSLDQPSDDVG